jgi:hypothetical protein
MIRIIIAGILGGLAMFCWSAFSHMVLQIDAGVDQLKNEAAVVSSLQANITEPGFYFVPGMDMNHASEAEQAEWAKKYEAGPNAIIIYHPTGENPMGPAKFGTELASNILACLFAAFTISLIAGGFLTRAIAGVLFGVIGWLSIDASYWNWYRFPTKMVTGELLDQLGGWLAAGIVIALIVKGRQALR